MTTQKTKNKSQGEQQPLQLPKPGKKPKKKLLRVAQAAEEAKENEHINIVSLKTSSHFITKSFPINIYT